MLQIHEKIKQARLSAGLTEAELAEKIGIKRSTYQYWETKTPPVDNIKKVARALGKNEDYFFTNDEVFVRPTITDDKDRTIADLAYSTRQLTDNNMRLVKLHEDLINKLLSSHETEKVSPPLKPKRIVKRDPVRKEDFLGKSKTRLNIVPDQRKGSVKNEGK